MRSLRTLVCLGAVLIGVGGRAHAQDPDVRDIPPLVMLVVDSSGSMEDLPACNCPSSTDCSICKPDCSLPNTFKEPPKKTLPSGQVIEAKKDRWAVTLEALTGKFNDYQCEALNRVSTNGFTGYDEKYPVPYHIPWSCGGTGKLCPYPGPAIQDNNGILDNYRDTLRFGLMTFDGEYTYKGGSDLINATDFSDTLSNGMPGMWSYADKQAVKYYGCSETYYVNSGVRSSAATEGGLVSLNSKSCADGDCDIYELNDTIQDQLLKTRPYGGTPIAASLDDLYYHLKKDVTDTFDSCRKRYAILITDGAPDPDFRELRCDCGDEDPTVLCERPEDNVKTADETEMNDFVCPYKKAPVIAKQLIDDKLVEQLFVLGMSVSDADAVKTLNEIAEAGNTKTALTADDPNTLRSTLDNVFGPLLNPVSRSVPAFAVGITGTQYQISTGFQVSASATSSVAPPWNGLIERRSFICKGDGELDSPDIRDEDRFHIVLANQGAASRMLLTAIPPGASTLDSNMLSGPLVKGDATAEYCQKGCDLISLDDTRITQGILNVTSSTARDDVLNWMKGATGPRKDKPLGDIYHSSPALIGAPKDEPADDAYTRFRTETAEVRQRPLIMYITTNDGILHAFSVEDYSSSLAATSHAGDKRLPLKPGTELWGFVPPILLKRLKNQLAAHQYNLDATPVVKDVFYKRGTSAADTDFHSVLITGMRGGGNGYLALDVTDPFDPKFLWQFTEKDMGLTYGQPEIVQATFLFKEPGADKETVQTRAVAILSGGVGKKKTLASTDLPGCTLDNDQVQMKKSGEAYASYVDDPTLVPGASQQRYRDRVQCWERQGRALYFVDVETGRLIKKVFDDDTNDANGTIFTAPVSGTPTAYQDAVATIADRGYVLDAEGVIWRIDMSSQDPVPDAGGKGWTVRPFHDLYWDKNVPDGAETTYERPILSLDRNRRVVVIVGTGDTDNFEKTKADNRIVSLTELTMADSPDDPDDYQALINWELRNRGASTSSTALVPSEMVTGSMALFEGQLFAATFTSVVSGADSCEYGRGRLWSLSYIDRDPGVYNVTWDGGSKTGTFEPVRIPVAAAETGTDSDADLWNKTLAEVKEAGKNLLVQGLGTTQRLTCTPPADPLFSYFSPTLTSIEQSQPPAIWVVAQASKGDKRSGSKLGSVQTKVTRPITFSRVTSWASSID
ncbi:MAG TPA: PilC/PilY family type IV pilus protein [Polyangiales bacterium]|nr:PilC/PilY family type IV pilus protein [Polyangiales bacterium]